VGNWILGGYTFPTKIAVHFDWAPGDLGSGRANAAWHSIVRVQNVESGAATRFAMNTRSLLYLPASVFVSLVVASLLWRRSRGLHAMAIGAAVLFVFLALSVTLPFTRFLADARIQAISLETGVKSSLDAAFNAWVVPPGMGYAVPGLIWLCAMWMSEPVAETSRALPGMDRVRFP
jgi:hypothetical protein